MEYKITTKDFDFYELVGKINEFGRNQFLTAKQVNNLQLALEEIVMNNILKKTSDIQIQIGYYEVDNKLSISLNYGGNSFNPFDAEDEDVLSMLLARQLTVDAKHLFNGHNTLNVDLLDINK
jgi:hypothetical protein